MKYTVKLQNVYSEILEETNLTLVVKRGRKHFIGPLFFEKDVDEVLKEIVEAEEVETENIEDVIDVAYKLLEKYNMLAKDGKTRRCMEHWQFINGLSDQLIYKN